MRILIVCVLLAACSSTSGKARTASADGPGAALPITRVVYRQYYPQSPIFVMENLGGRDLVALRSARLDTGKPPVAYVPDGIMRTLLEEFERFGLSEHLRPRPANPRALGGVAELTLVGARGETRSFIRIRTPKGREPTDAYKQASRTYLQCVESFRAVWDRFRPYGQYAAARKGDFGVKRAEFGDR